MNTKVGEYIPSELLYQKNPKILSYLKERRPVRVYPTSTSDYRAGQLLEFEIRSDNFIDVQCAMLNFHLSFPTPSTKIANALDVIQSARVFYNDIQLESIENANSINNLFLAYNASRTWAESEGDVYLGLDTQYASTSRPSGTGDYSIPLALVLGLFRSLSSYLPVMGNRLRLSFTLAPDAQVISRCVNTTDTYSMSKISLVYDEIITESRFRKGVMDAMSSTEGLRLPFTSCIQQTLNLGTSNSFFGKLTFNLSNVLSLHMLLDDSAKDVREGESKDQSGEDVPAPYTLSRQSFGFPGFDKCFVRVGSQNLTPADGIKSYVELFQNANKTISCFNDIHGSGLLKYASLTGTYDRSRRGDAISHEDYPMCPISIDCSKMSGVSDDAVVNQGVSASGVNEFQIELYRTSGSNFTSSNSLICSLVHKRAIVLSQGGCVCDF